MKSESSFSTELKNFVKAFLFFSKYAKGTKAKAAVKPNNSNRKSLITVGAGDKFMGYSPVVSRYKDQALLVEMITLHFL